MNKKIVKVKELNMQQKLFCYYYTTKGETHGNAYKSYSLAYDYPIPTNSLGEIDYKSKEYQVVQAASSRLLRNDRVAKEIENMMLDKLNPRAVDSRLSSILHHGKDSDSINAIKIYNEINNRIVKNLNLNITARPFQEASDADLIEILNEGN